MARGTVNITRELWDDTDFRDGEMTQREAFIWMVAHASYRDRTRNILGKPVSTSRGQLAAATRYLAAKWLWSEPRVRRYLDLLENRRTIRRKTDAGITVITLCKYDDYQGGPRATDARPTHPPTHDRRTTDAIKDPLEIQEKDPAADDTARGADLTYRERILEACGLTDLVSGLTGHGGHRLGTEIDMVEATKWKTDLGLAESQVLALIREIIGRKGQAPKRLRYFTAAMQDFAGELTRAPLSANDSRHDRDHRTPRKPSKRSAEAVSRAAARIADML